LTDHRASKAQKCSAVRQLGDLHLQARTHETRGFDR
jgi:hypothetical protein